MLYIKNYSHFFLQDCHRCCLLLLPNRFAKKNISLNKRKQKFSNVKHTFFHIIYKFQHKTI